MTKIFLSVLLFPFAVFAQPANDEPCGATNLTVGTGSGSCLGLDFIMSGASYNAAYAISCAGSVGSPVDVWFKALVPPSGKLSIFTSVQAGSPVNDAVMHVYQGVDCTSMSYLACNDDFDQQNLNYMPALLNLAATAGQYIFVRISQYNGQSDGLFNICATNPQVPLALNQKVGIGLSSPDSTLDINGNMIVRGGARIANTLQLNSGLKITAGSPAAGKVLTSDANGNASWQAAVALPAGAANQTLRHNGTSFISNSTLQNDGSNITIGGQLKIQGGAPAAGKVLTTDATGLGSWQTIPAQLPAASTNQTLRYNGSSYVANGALQNDGTNVTVSGQLKIQGGSPGTGKVLTSDATGLGTWQAGNNNTGVALFLNGAVPFTANNGVVTVIPFYAGTDDGGNYSSSQYIAPSAGFYHFHVAVSWPSATFTGSKFFQIRLYKNGSFNYVVSNYYSTADLPASQSASFDLRLNANDAVDFRALQGSGLNLTVDPSFSYGGGYKIY